MKNRGPLRNAMRRFITVSHTGRSDGDWSLNDLAGAAGRIDVLCRNLQAALFLSHGLREDTQFYAVFPAVPAVVAGSSPSSSPVSRAARTVRVEGAKVQMLHPDERSTAARLQQALRDPWSVPDWKEVQRGLSVARFDLEGLLDDLGPAADLVFLDPQGTPLDDWSPPAEPTFILSDHLPFTPEEAAAIDARGAQRVSLGPHWYHGNHAVSVVHWHLDQQRAPVVRDPRAT